MNVQETCLGMNHRNYSDDPQATSPQPIPFPTAPNATCGKRQELGLEVPAVLYLVRGDEIVRPGHCCHLVGKTCYFSWSWILC